ncbi:prenyltransferase [Nocardiopsis sp. N85]|uniref:prenyltransferase n=1 Tax=Nocardiopsis sp. N85 TaxID=3029400 RepID=UPI00237F8525|nr:prenyltransferase [Nocardiopsis sp. N85]MDE3720325.1 prenyltransferase [Nocardiopsis sp. N85]
MTWESFLAAEHFIMRTARLLDRHRFAYHFQAGPAQPVRSALSAYRNIDGGYGNALDPDLRGHASQPLAVDTALRVLDELGPVPHDLGQGICRHLAAVAAPDGGLPPVTSAVRHTESAPWWRQRTDFGPDLALTASVTGRLHRHNITHPWRDRATAYCWKHIDALHWTEPHEAVGICAFLQHVPDRPRALHTINRLSTMIRAAVNVRPADGAGVPGPRSAAPRHHVHTPLDLAPDPSCIARPLFTDSEIDDALERLERTQRPDGGWDTSWDHWDTAATLELEGMRTVQRLRVLRAYGRLAPTLPTPRRDR